MTDIQPDHETEARLRDWLAAPKSAFDVLVGEKALLPNDTVLIDRSFLDREFEAAFPERFGAFPLELADPALQKVALSFARRLAKVEAARLGVSVSGLTHAWFHAVYAEVTTLVPIRHLARQLLVANKDRIFVIDLSSAGFSAINYWRYNEMEPIYLANELRRLGAPTCFLIEALNKPVFRFELSGAWRRKWHTQFSRNTTFSTALCEKHMRRDAFVAEQSGASRRLRPGVLTRLRARLVGRDNGISLTLRDGPAINGFRTYSAPAEVPNILDGFRQLMTPPTVFLRDWIRYKIGQKTVETVHISDHASLEGGLLAAEVRDRGGEVQIWPHSANAVDVNVHVPGDIAKATLAARSTANVWVKKFGVDKVSVDIRTVLPETSMGPSFDDSQPVHVVLFGGAHALQRVPFFALEKHKASWEATLAGLQAADVRLTVKHKSQWETRCWIRQRAAVAADLNFSRTPANTLSLPNMVFMSISLTSTALFEGIARGIPAIVVRDVAVFETPYYDPNYIPCLPSSEVATFVSGLNRKEAWEDLRRKQLEWFGEETSDRPFETTV
ncbi:MAG: hypothetical protein AAF636_26570 [Pseudomonadota bacterium]